jgi:hypothetical protein
MGRMGRLRVVGTGVYTGISPDGTGPQQRFTYDPGSGSIQWAGGRIPGVSGTVESSHYAIDARGVGFLVVQHRLRAGGNVATMTCARE